jgi:hypothetical protein
MAFVGHVISLSLYYQHNTNCVVKKLNMEPASVADFKDAQGVRITAANQIIIRYKQSQYMQSSHKQLAFPRQKRDVRKRGRIAGPCIAVH